MTFVSRSLAVTLLLAGLATTAALASTMVLDAKRLALREQDFPPSATRMSQNTVVWQVQVSSVRNPFGFSGREAQAELTRYALKQGKRVGTR